MSQSISDSTQAKKSVTDADDAKRWGIIMAVVLAAVHLPFIALQMKQSMSRPHYQFALLIPIGFVVLLLPRLKEAQTLEPGNKLVGALGFGFALFLQMIAVAFFSPFVGCIAAMVSVLAAGYVLGSWRGVFLFLPCVIFLALMVPPPFELDTRVISALQSFTSRKGSLVLDYFGIYHLLDGNVIEVPNRRLFVEEACSGIHGLLSTLVCAVFYIAFVRRHWLTSILLVLASIFWVLVLNTVRVTVISIALTKFDVDLSEGWPHEILGIVIFVVNLLLLLSTDQLLLFFSPESWTAPETAPKRSRSGLASLPLGLRIASVPLAVLFGVIAVAQAAVGVPLFLRKTVTAEELIALRETSTSDPFAYVTEDWMPAKFEGWTKFKFEALHRDRNHIMGEYSKVWYYRHVSGQQIIFSYDYTFPIEHDLTICYAGTGWTIAKRRIENEAAATDPTASRPYCAARLTQPDRYAYMCFSLIDKMGNPLRMLSQNQDKTLGELFGDNFRSLKERLDDSLMTLGVKSGTPRRKLLSQLTQDNGQLQLFTMNFLPIPAEREAKLQKLFLDLRQQFQSKLAQVGKKGK